VSDGRRHDAAIEQAFTLQADAFEDARTNRPFTDEADWMLEALPLDAEAIVLDVAAGTGHVARRIARGVRAVIALDATAAMLARGHEAAVTEGVTNIVFMRGEATALPFLDGSFDLVVSRFAAHHLERPDRLAAEMARCGRPGATVALFDMVADPDPAIAAEQNRIERLRDPSHVEMLGLCDLRTLLAAAGLELRDLSTRPVRRPLTPWLEQTQISPAEADEIRSRFADELAGRAGPTGFSPAPGGDGLTFVQTFAALVASVPA
jgi:SAM-dependent methyltransferase